MLVAVTWQVKFLHSDWRGVYYVRMLRSGRGSSHAGERESSHNIFLDS